MKTNHRREFRDTGSFRDRSGQIVAKSRLTGKYGYIPNDFTNGHRGHAKAVSGAKKYVRSRDRQEGKRIVQKAMRET